MFKLLTRHVFFHILQPLFFLGSFKFNNQEKKSRVCTRENKQLYIKFFTRCATLLLSRMFKFDNKICNIFKIGIKASNIFPRTCFVRIYHLYSFHLIGSIILNECMSDEKRFEMLEIQIEHFE